MQLMKIILFFFFICQGMFVSAVSGRRIVFTPQWSPQSQFAGYYVALEKGFYAERGLDVTIQHPSHSNSAINKLLDGSSDIITTQLVNAIVMIGEGKSMVNVMQTSQQSSLIIVPRSPEVRKLTDLKGKKVGIWYSAFGNTSRIQKTVFDLDFQWIPFVNSINLFISGAIDATLATSYNEYLHIKAAGFDLPTVFPFSEMGYDIPEDGIYVTKEYLRTHPDEVADFTQASRRGWEWAEEYPDEALEIVMKYVKAENIGTSPVIQKFMLKEILRLQYSKNASTRPFTLSPEQVEFTSHFLLKHGFVKKEVSYNRLIGKE